MKTNNNPVDIEPIIDSDSAEHGVFHAIVEIPKGSRNKYEVDKKTGLIRLDRHL